MPDAHTRRRGGSDALYLPIIAAVSLALVSPNGSTPTRTAADWRDNVRAFAEAHLQHTAWGPAHARRDYETTLMLARAEGIAVDTEAVYAAAYLHDMGGIPPYAKPRVLEMQRFLEALATESDSLRTL